MLKDLGSQDLILLSGENPAETEKFDRLKKSFLRAIQEEIEDPQTGRNLEYLIDSFPLEDIKKLAISLQSLKSCGELKVMEQVGRMQKERIKKNLDPKKRTVALYFPTSAYRDHLGNIARGLRDKGYNVLIFIGNVCGDPLEKEAFYAGLFGRLELMNFMDFVDVFICPILATDLPSSGKKVYFLHDIHDSPLGDQSTMVQIANRLSKYDYVFMPSNEVIDLFKKTITTAQPLGSAARKICFIPGGYIKLDRFMEFFEKNRRDEKVIVYAPTVTGCGLDDLTSLYNYGEEIVENVLEGFPDYFLIFRPHPHSLHTPPVKKITARYSLNSHFIFDQGASYLKNYSRAALMITDLSGTAFTYSFATLRPVLFFSPNEEELQRRYGYLQYLKDREKVGQVLKNASDLKGKIDWLLEHRNFFAENIKKYRDALIFHVGKAEEYFLENFEYIVQGEKAPDWIYP